MSKFWVTVSSDGRLMDGSIMLVSCLRQAKWFRLFKRKQNTTEKETDDSYKTGEEKKEEKGREEKRREEKGEKIEREREREQGERKERRE